MPAGPLPLMNLDQAACMFSIFIEEFKDHFPQSIAEGFIIFTDHCGKY